MEEVNEYLMKFLDADDYEDKLRILEEAKDKVEDRVIGMMASALSISTGGAEGDDLLDLISVPDDLIEIIVHCFHSFSNW